MSTVLNFSLGLQKIECCNCHMAFAMSVEFYNERRRERDSFYCPAGHRQHFTGPSEEEKLRKLLADRERTLQWERDRAQSARNEAERMGRQLSAQKGLLTKAKKKLARVENGVCPECNRTFSNIARHMQSKHGIECNKPPKGSKVRG